MFRRITAAFPAARESERAAASSPAACTFKRIAALFLIAAAFLPTVCSCGSESRPEQTLKPITVGSNVWMGGCVTVNGGVTIGDNVVIGSGSVVTHDIPSNVIAAGNPCRVLRPLTDADRAHWQQEAARWRAACGR